MARRPSVLVVDDERNMLTTLERILSKRGWDVRKAATGETALEALSRGPADVVLSDLRMPGMDGLALQEEVARRWPATPFVILTGQATVESAIQALKRGAADYVLKPCDPEELVLVLDRVARHEGLARKLRLLEQEADRASGFGEVVGESPAIREVRSIIQAVGPTPATVLIVGETGTGKDLVARWLHRLHAPEAPFLAVNCASIPPGLLESQLFGHLKGAFTGATADHPGLFRAAGDGTLLLDEVSEMPLELQARLLRVLEAREVLPVGATSPVPVAARLLAAANRDLEALVDQGRFRADLYYRIHVVQVTLPPLRERREDLPALVGRFLTELAGRYGVAPMAVSPAALEALAAHDWPGNVRELRNVIERAFALGGRDRLDLVDLPAAFRRPPPPGRSMPTQVLPWEERERAHIVEALEATGGNKLRAAELLRIDRKRLYRKIRRYGL